MTRTEEVVGFLAVIGVPIAKIDSYGKGSREFIERVGGMQMKRVDIDGMSVFYWWRDTDSIGQPDPDPLTIVDGDNASIIFKSGLILDDTKCDDVNTDNWSAGNGRYTWFRWESMHSKLTATTDFLGIRALFYIDAGDVFAFSNEPSTLLKVPDFNGELDPVGCVDMLQKGCCLGDRTLFKQIKFLQPGAKLIREKFKTRIAGSGLPLQMPEPSLQSIDTLADGLFEHLNISTKRRLQHRNDWHVLLSGGLDSRVCAGLLHHNNALGGCVNWGDPSRGDSLVPARIAKSLGVDLHRISIPADHLKQYSSDLFTLGGGLINAHITYLISAMHSLSKPRPPLVLGYSGDPLTGGHVPLQTPNGETQPEIALSVDHFNSALGRFFHADELSRLLTHNEWKDAIPAARDEIYKVMSSVASDNHYQRWIAALLWCRQLRYTTFLPRICEGFTPCFSPFEDKDTFEYCLALPAESLKNQYAYRRMIERCMPKLAKIPKASGETVTISGASASKKIYNYLVNTIPEKYRWRLEWWSGGGYSVDPNADLREGSAEYLNSLASSHEEWDMFLDKGYVSELIEDHLSGRTKQGFQIQALVMVLEAIKASNLIRG